MLHSARISPFANTSRLDDGAVDRLHAAIGVSIERGLVAECMLDDMGRSEDRPNDVHHRVRPAVPGLRRHGALDRVPPVSRGLLPGCQTGGKVLADNTTSRFLK